MFRWLRGPRSARGAEQVQAPEGGTAVDAGAVAPGSADAAAGSDGSQGSGGRGGWSAVPPVQRILEAPRTVAETGFAASLSAHRDPSFGGELGHDVRASAPGGLLRGVLTSLPAAGAGTPARLDLPVLRLPVVGRRGEEGQEGQEGRVEAGAFGAVGRGGLPGGGAPGGGGGLTRPVPSRPADVQRLSSASSISSASSASSSPSAASSAPSVSAARARKSVRPALMSAPGAAGPPVRRVAVVGGAQASAVPGASAPVAAERAPVAAEVAPLADARPSDVPGPIPPSGPGTPAAVSGRTAAVPAPSRYGPIPRAGRTATDGRAPGTEGRPGIGSRPRGRSRREWSWPWTRSRSRIAEQVGRWGCVHAGVQDCGRVCACGGVRAHADAGVDACGRICAYACVGVGGRARVRASSWLGVGVRACARLPGCGGFRACGGVRAGVGFRA